MLPENILCKNRKRKCEFKMVLVPPANRLFTNTLASDLLLEHNIFYFVLDATKLELWNQIF